MEGAHHRIPASRVAEAESFFKAANLISAAIVATDCRAPDDPIVFCNEAFLQLVGYDRDEVIGLNSRFMQGAATDPAAVAELGAAIRERRAASVEILNYRKDGSPFWNSVSLSPVFSREGEPIYFIAVLVDVTARRAFETGYRRAQKLAAVSQLTAGLAHDLNNLLQVVAGNLDFAKRRCGEDAVLRGRLEHATLAMERAAKLTHQLLTFSRHVHLEPVLLDLHGWLRGVHDLLDGKLGSQVRLRLDLGPTDVQCFVDPVHLEMAVLNTLLNARDALPQGGEVCLTTSLRQVTTEGSHGLTRGDYVALCIVDKGHGMPKDVRLRATDPFFTTKPEGRGNGLGLSMVRSFAQQSGGGLEIDSAPGEGTTVRILLPVGAERVRPALPEDDEHGPVPPPDLPSRIAVILAGDEQVSAPMQAHLENGGYVAIAAQSLDEALALLAGEERADLVLAGDVDGEHAQAEIADRLRGECPSAAVVTLSELGLSEPGSASALEHSDVMNRLNAALNHRAAGP